MLEISNLETGYGKKQVLFGPSIEVKRGEIVALIGPNGAGKSTVLKAVCGLIPTWSGEIAFEGKRLNGSTPAQNVVRGITFAPQGNRVFDELTVMENLEIGGFRLPRTDLKGRIEEMFELFPVLRERSRKEAGTLSGGEKQMLAIARALVPRPKLLLLDEPSLGLSPALVSSAFSRIVEVNQNSGVTILIVEQRVREVLHVCHRVYALRFGKVAFSGEPGSLSSDTGKLRELFL